MGKLHITGLCSAEDPVGGCRLWNSCSDYDGVRAKGFSGFPFIKQVTPFGYCLHDPILLQQPYVLETKISA